MKISIITTTFNSVSSIQNSIDSVAKQTYPTIEHIIIDGASTDGTVEKLDSCTKNNNSNLRFISEPDFGIYDALNKGIQLSSGQVIGILHSDDFFSDQYVIEKVMSKFEEGYDIVYGDLQYISKINSGKIVRNWLAGEYKTLRYGWMPPHPALFLRKSVYEKYGNYNLKFSIASDYDFILRIFKDNSLRIAYLNEVLVKMRLGGKSNNNINNIVQKSWEDYQALKLNSIPFPLFTLFCKNVRKLSQFF